MRRLALDLARALLAIWAVLAAAALARGETFTLELKRLEAPSGFYRGGAEAMYRATMPQNFFVELGPQGGNLASVEGQAQAAEFKRLVKKEPHYQSAFPFRGVARLGSQQFAFALDTVPPPPKDGQAKGPAAQAPEKKPNADSAVAKAADRLHKATAPAETPTIAALGYNRLYFDFNHNGDLTDDKVIEVDARMGRRPMSLSGRTYASFQFPRVDVTIDAAGTRLPYSFILAGHAVLSEHFSYTSIALSSAVYREGDITLAGKRRHVVLLDFNSNGRFDDEIKLRDDVIGDDVHTPDGRLYPDQGDMLLIDPNPSAAGRDSPYDITSGSSRQNVSKLVCIDGRFYGVKISAAGDKLTLTPSTVPLGRIANPNQNFRAVIYGDQGFLKINGNSATPVAVPAGQWKLLSYTIDQAGTEPPSPPAEKAGPSAEKAGSSAKTTAKSGKPSGSSLLGAMAEALLGGGGPATDPDAGRTIVSASATAKYPAIKLAQGKTVALPFGPPYKAVVRGDFFEDGNQAQRLSLGMSLVGSAGETCTDVTVDGSRPPKPEFTITDPQGKVVQEGSFEYG